MYLLFLDESGKIDQGGLFALGGIAIRDTDWPELRRLWQETSRTRQQLEQDLRRKAETASCCSMRLAISGRRSRSSGSMTGFTSCSRTRSSTTGS
jgi:hypothetical protein